MPKPCLLLSWPAVGTRIDIEQATIDKGHDMKSILIVLNDAPYGNERVYNALRLAGALASRDDLQVRLFLMSDAVGCAKAGHRPPSDFYNLQAMLENIARTGLVALCGTCMDTRALDESELVAGAARSTLAQLADWTVEAHQVLVF